MKKFYYSVLFIFLTGSVFSQINLRNDETITAPNKNINSQNPVNPSPALYSKVEFEPTECISKEQQQIMQKQIDDNIAMLRSKNPTACKKTSMVHPLFIWPTQAKAGFTDYGYYTVQFLVDHNPAPVNNLLDYNCGNRTYDWASGNHAGTDIILWPYPWRRMDEQVEEVIAAAPGIIVNKVDGNFDRNCTNNGSGTWNAIHVQHDDGSIAWYLHFKTGSLTAKNVGDSVALGEYLGTAGSSGSSSWPHLHFQVMDNNGNLIDPWDGSCNSINAGDSWWQTQQPYDVPSINRICSKSTLLDYYSCPNDEITFEKDTFNINDSLCLWIYTRDMELNSSMQVNIYSPSNQNLINWNFTVPWATNPTSYVRWYYVVDSWWVQGWWTFEVVYNGNTYQHQFYMTHTATGLNQGSSDTWYSFFPNPSNNEINISCNENTKAATINIVDALGKQIYSSALLKRRNKINTADWSNGIYLLQLKSEKETTLQKIMIQH